MSALATSDRPSAHSDHTVTVVIVVLPESSIMSLASVLDPIRAANRVAGKTLFDWKILSPDGEPVLLTCGVVIAVAGAFSARVQGDCLLIIGGFNLERHAQKPFIASLQASARHFSVVAGIESGCWLLARCGLINGRTATAHWEELEDFALTFPDVSVKADRFVTDGKFWTSGGASPTFDMMLHLIRQQFGSSVALDVASIFVYDETHAATDAQPLVSLGRMEARDPDLARAIRLMERTLDRPLSMSALALRAGQSQRQLEMRFARALGISPGSYYLRLRLQTAHRLVSDTQLGIREVALRCGFDSLSSFSRAFKRQYGGSPMKLRQGRR
ncbi:GlxA family transcriptional regulator [Rhizobium sp. LjRoot98]|uniref:GlxA family transcriptional regulator n=1 Tax=unclassified Rhizobium TaxID=2613769 RepID=UPI000713D227|nr:MULTISPECIES: GlxA family transcriptional regulator [unclassified Rhizobium]KQV31175.1 AraC family transcriptional regulator [Rhizobium sp. Root1204]KQY10878.1 AraC family transcriptional regulator [Rhizobium sp. Root1334]KRC04862.1 AraC family transcriptional regulator [Rhizobium sp. Root73]